MSPNFAFRFLGATDAGKKNQFALENDLTQHLNKGHGYHTMVRELSMTQVAHVGPYQAQSTHIPSWGHWGPW